jgi:dTDP-L-rhamnose 4-epimerase
VSVASRERVLVTGGAGFIGSHLVDALVRRGDRVTILDDLEPQAHPDRSSVHCRRDAELIVGDLRNPEVVARALDGVELVYHLGGMVGNGQSMFDVRRYVDVNAVGTATLLEQIILRRRAIRRLVVASSMVVYGDGAYACAQHGEFAQVERPLARLRRRQWEPICAACGNEVEPIPITEERPLRPNSVYGISKRDQEELCLVLGRTYSIPTIALRYLCTYGSRQALGNPYTGVAAIWAGRLLNGRRPVVFEDGRQLRDLIHVSDTVAATLRAADAPSEADFQALNVGSGQRHTISDLATFLGKALGCEIEPELTSEYRAGDIRHCFADISRARSLLGWEPRVALESGVAELATWAREQKPIDNSEAANAELRARGVIQ